MNNRMTVGGYLVSYTFGFNEVWLRIYVNKRKGQLVKADITPIEGPWCYIADTYTYDRYFAITVCCDTRSFKSIKDLVEWVVNNLTVTKYIDMNSSRASYELQRALNNG